MVNRMVTVASKLGLHLQLSDEIVRCAEKHASSITIAKGGQIANAKNLLEILALAATHGSELIVTANGDDEKDALKVVCNLIKKNY
jgi:phosphocarrier protein HPr